MRVLVLGGTRFIGPRIVHRLVAAGHDVAIFHRGQTSLSLPAAVQDFCGDRHRLAEHAALLRRFRPDVVIDMVAFTEADARALVENFRNDAGHLVVISSGDVYRAFGLFTRLESGSREPTPLTEDGPLRQTLYIARTPGHRPGDELYDYEKILVERVVMTVRGLPATVLRLPMVHGPGDPQHRLASYLRRMLDGRPAIVLNEGMARWRCPRGYVEDVAAAVALAALHPAPVSRIYNVAEPVAFTESEWVARITATVGWSGEIVAIPDEAFPVPFDTTQDLAVDSTRIRRELGYREVVDSDQALRETIAWERDHLPELPVDYAREDELLGQARKRSALP